MINERCDKKLKEYKPWEIISKLNKNIKVKLDIGVGFILNKLDSFLNIIASDYCNLNVSEIDCFYFMESERIKSCEEFIKTNLNIKKINFKVVSEEPYFELIEVIKKYPILNVRIEYGGQVTQSVIDLTKAFIISSIDRNIEVYCDENEKNILERA